MSITIHRNGKGLDAIVRRLKDHAVTVGVHADAGFYPNGVSVAENYAWQEYGTPTIPERSTLRATMAARRKKYTAIMATLAAAAIEGTDRIKPGMARLGELARNDVKDAIVKFDDPGNSETTIAAKGRDDPLIDTRRLLTSVEYKHAD